MKNANKITGILTSTLMLLVINLPMSHAQRESASFGPNWDLIVLSPGVSRTVTYDLSDNIQNDAGAFNATFILTSGAGTLTFSVASSSPIGKGAEIVYVTTGFIGTTPIIDYAYSSGSITQTVELPGFGIGILFTAIVASFNNANFPVTMSMSFALQE